MAMSWLLARIKEPSTWAGIGLVASAIEQMSHAIATNTTPAGAIAAVAGGALAIVTNERTSPPA